VFGKNDLKEDSYEDLMKKQTGPMAFTWIQAKNLP
jgi:hypothetical protein